MRKSSVRVSAISGSEVSFLAALVLVAVLSVAALSVVESLSLEDMTEASSRIVNGHVAEISSYWEGGRIFTDVTIFVLSYISGSGPSVITVRIPGGTVGQITESVSDAPEFELGQEVILFLRDQYFEVVGWQQGKFTIQDEIVAETGQSKIEFIQEVTKIQSQLSPPEKGQLEPLLEPTAEVFDASLYRKVESASSPDGKSGASDAAGKEAEGDPNPALATILSEDFEVLEFPYSPWSVYAQSSYTNTYWDDVSTSQDADTKVHSGAWSIYCADEGASRVWPPGPYPANMSAWMIYGPFTLADANDAELLFYVWSRTEPGCDYFKYFASVDGVNFHGYQMSGDYATSCGGYCERRLDLKYVPTLGNLCGQPQVWIAFLFTSNASNEYEGAYIDDVTLRKNTGPQPTVNSISPTSGPARAAQLGSTDCAADSTEVTIAGVNFGATQGTSYVRFWRREDTYYNGCVTSWNDTQIKVRVPGRVSSGNILVHTDDGGDSNTKYFTVTYSYGGGKWPGPSPMIDYYYVNPNTADTTGELADVQAAANTWNSVPIADFNFRYGGTTATAAVDFDDHRNVIFWNPVDTGSIATNHTWWDATSNLTQFDIEFNDASYSWATDGSAGNMDVWNTAIHELGHSLQLLDLYGTADTEKTMYGYGSTGDTSKRTLHSDDIAGLYYMYPQATTPAVFRVGSSGDVLADGGVYAPAFVTCAGCADVAEWVTVSEPVEPGDVLELDPWNPGQYRKAVGPCSSLVAGVVSTEPGFALGSPSHSMLPTTHAQALLALVGIVPVKACDENGPIALGDLVVPSSRPGYVMRWDDERFPNCTPVGKALQELGDGTGAILILLMR